MTGIDVSNHQGTINWANVAAGGAKFAYAKVTEGVNFTDAYFAANYGGAKANGLYAGAYHFARPDRSSGQAQADYFLDRAKYTADGRTLPPMLDIEWPWDGSGSPSPCYGLSQSQMVNWIRAFVDRVRERTGRATMIYTNTNWWNPCTGNNASFGANPLFIANYSGSSGQLPAGWTKWTLWQYADSGALPGDQDVFNGTPAEFAALTGGSPNLGVLDFLLSDDPASNVHTRAVINYGNSPMVPIVGDWDGNGTDTPSGYDPTSATFLVSNTPETGQAQYSFRYGNPGAQPLVGDWDGDGKDNIGVRMGNTFFLRTSPVTSGTETTTSVAFGDASDTPAIGDWDGDGKDNVGFYRPSAARFYLRTSANTDPVDVTTVVLYGNTNAQPLIGDWNGDGKDNIGVRMGNTFFFRTSEVNDNAEVTASVAYGNGTTEIPIVGDWDGNGTDTQGIVA
ncbi:GH25 family lysozyme [Amycolatopsis sp. NPDC051758]|uniref:GH25 family lysozyme n=1 Tax=Amycolatopsis sp. NPDC051758 TaxID=3363935 RepID=UPI0037926154